MSPLEAAALDAWDEAARLRDELTDTAALLSGDPETGSVSGNRVAWETFRAWERAVERAREVQQLADDDAGVFNAWDAEEITGPW